MKKSYPPPNNLRIVIVLSLVLCVTILSSTHAENPVVMYPVEIKFSFTQGGNQDAITIKKNLTTAITAPEYVYQVKNDPFAYLAGESGIKVMVSFYSSCPYMDIVIDATVTSGTGIGYIHKSITNYHREDYVTLDITGTIPQSIGKYNFTWQWDIEATPNVPGYVYTETTRYTTHTYYTVIDYPQYPMSVPWTDALDVACDWASGSSTEESIEANMTESLHDCGFYYIGGTAYGRTSFNFTQFLSEVGENIGVNCIDMAHALVALSNSLGCNLFITLYFPKRSISDRFYINCIDPIGSTQATNNVFSFPLIGYDCREGGFGWHAFAENSDNKVWDATFRYDVDGIPDNVTESYPDGCGYTVTGHQWVLPISVNEGTYVQNLVDSWNMPGGEEENEWDCADPYNCGDFDRGYDFGTIN